MRVLRHVVLANELEPVTGIEPVLLVYKTSALPLDDTGMEPERGIEPRWLSYEESWRPPLPAWYPTEELNPKAGM